MVGEKFGYLYSLMAEMHSNDPFWLVNILNICILKLKWLKYTRLEQNFDPVLITFKSSTTVILQHSEMSKSTLKLFRISLSINEYEFLN